MMKVKSRIMVIMGLLLCVACNVGASEISLRVVDESNTPVVEADATIAFAAPQQKDSKGNYGKTDKKGYFSAKGRNTVGMIVKVEKNGYYEWVRENGFGQKNHDLTVVMRKIDKPIPLYVRRVLLRAPVFDKWLGFDFAVGDWVAPQGKGKSRDILFKFKREFKGYRFSEEKLEKMKFPDTTEEDLKKFYGKWDGVLQIGFPSDLAGIIEKQQSYLRYSEMKMPHLAPEEGYQSEEIVIKKKSHRSEEESLKELQDYARNGVPETKPKGFFIRTRVVEVNGKIIKANYVKMQLRDEDEDRGETSPFRVGAAGTINFIYYFNPTPNDRNLEFNSKANLATDQKRFYAP